MDKDSQDPLTAKSTASSTSPDIYTITKTEKLSRAEKQALKLQLIADVGNSMGSGEPAVFGPWVARVRVRCPDLATRALPRTLTVGWRVSTGLQGTPSGKIFSTILTFTDIILS